MPTRNINLTDHLDRFIDAEVSSGRYGNASEVVGEGLRLIERQKQEDRAKPAWLRGAVKEGLDQLNQGKAIEFSSLGELERGIDELAAEASADPVRKAKRA